jgi:hypothetical protein
MLTQFQACKNSFVRHDDQRAFMTHCNAARLCERVFAVLIDFFFFVDQSDMEGWGCIGNKLFRAMENVDNVQGWNFDLLVKGLQIEILMGQGSKLYSQSG